VSLGKRLPIVVAAGVAVLVVLVLLLLVLPKKSQVGKARSDLETARTEAQGLQMEAERLLALKAEAPAMKEQAGRIQTAMPPTVDLPGLTNFLQLAQDRANVETTAVTYSPPAPQEGFSTIPISITVAGSFFDLDAYLYRLERLPRAVKVIGVSISPSAWPVLEMSLTAEAYTSDTEAGPGSTPGHQGTGALASPAPVVAAPPPA